MTPPLACESHNSYGEPDVQRALHDLRARLVTQAEVQTEVMFMVNLGHVGARSVRRWREAVARGIGRLLLSLVAVMCLAHVAEASITIRRHMAYDNFFFHGSYSTDAFDPNDSFSLEIWNCANGGMPIYVADREPLIMCAGDAATGFTLGDLVYSVSMPAGSCIDHGRSCYYRNGDVPSVVTGVRYFRVQYSRPGRGNRVWLDSYGDLSRANQANMLILIKINGHPRATREDTFIPLSGGNGGWRSR